MNRKFWGLAILISATVLGLVIFRIFTNGSPKPATPLLQAVVEEALAGTKGTYAVVVKNLQTGEKFEKLEHVVFDAGSLYKIWVLAAAFEQLELGHLSPDEMLSDSVANLNKKFGLEPEEAEITDGNITVRVGQAIQQMVVISHNYSAMLLTERLTAATISAYMQKQGFSESLLGDSPKTTAFDMAMLFEKLYHGELVSAEGSQKMLDILKKQALNEKIPKYLPEGTMVAHKTGEIDYFSHDAGIIFGTRGDYLVVVLSRSDSPYGAEERISLLAKAVHDYFEEKLHQGI